MSKEGGKAYQAYDKALRAIETGADLTQNHDPKQNHKDLFARMRSLGVPIK